MATHPTDTPRRAVLSLDNLRRWNLLMAALHFVQGAVLLAIASDFSLPVTSSFVKFNPRTEGLEPRLEVNGQVIPDSH